MEVLRGSEEVVWHIPSRYSEEMAQKSEVVSIYIHIYIYIYRIELLHLNITMHRFHWVFCLKMKTNWMKWQTS